MLVMLPNALVQLQAHYHHCGEAASEKCLSAATFVRSRGASAASRAAVRLVPKMLRAPYELLRRLE